MKAPGKAAGERMVESGALGKEGEGSLQRRLKDVPRGRRNPDNKGGQCLGEDGQEHQMPQRVKTGFTQKHSLT